MNANPHPANGEQQHTTPGLPATAGELGIAGVNLGFGFCKLVLDGVEDSFMSALTPLQRRDDGLQTRQPLAVNVVEGDDGKLYEAGIDGVLGTRDEPLKVLSREWGRTRHYRLLMGAALNRMAATGKRRWSIVTGLAADHYMDAAYRADITALWAGRNGLHETRHGAIEVVSVRVMPETAGGYFELLSNRELNLLMRASSGAVVDFGRMTVNWLPFKGDQADSNRMGSVDVGVSNVIAEATKLVRAEARSPNLHPLDVEAAMLGIRPIHKIVTGEGGKVLPQPIGMDIPVTKAVSEVWPRVEQAISNNLGDLRGEVLIAIGGGAAIFGGLLRETYPASTVIVADDAQMANARGLYRLARLQAARKREVS